MQQEGSGVMVSSTSAAGASSYPPIAGTLPEEQYEWRGAPVARLAFWLFLAGEIIILLTLIGASIFFRLTYPGWNEASSYTNVVISTINTLVLLTGSLTAVLAHHYAFASRWALARLYLVLTMLCGFTFLGIKVFEYSREIMHGFLPNTNAFWMFYYGITGIHGLHVLAGSLIILGVLFYIRKKPSKYAVENAALYWHFVDVVWLYIFPMFYLT